MRNGFTTIFGGVGRRRSVITRQTKKRLVTRNKMAKIRRAHQGWRNEVFGTLNALKIRLQFGRLKSTPQFRR